MGVVNTSVANSQITVSPGSGKSMDSVEVNPGGISIPSGGGSTGTLQPGTYQVTGNVNGLPFSNQVIVPGGLVEGGQPAQPGLTGRHAQASAGLTTARRIAIRQVAEEPSAVAVLAGRAHIPLSRVGEVWQTSEGLANGEYAVHVTVDGLVYDYTVIARDGEVSLSMNVEGRAQ